MTRIVVILLASTTLAGCAAKQWTKTGASAADLAQAKLECQYEAKKTENTSTPRNTGDAVVSGLSEGMKQVELMNMCMQIKGYSAS